MGRGIGASTSYAGSVFSHLLSALPRSLKTLTALSLAGLCLAGCQSDPQSQYSAVPGLPNSGTRAPAAPAVPVTPVATTSPPATATQQAPPPVGTGRDTMRVGDTIVITFTDLPYPLQPLERRIAEDGTITLLENQTFTAAGKSPAQLEKEIRERYVPNFFVKMSANVAFKEATQFYYVGGEVKNPGRQVYISRIKVLGAIKSAGDFTDFAYKTKVQLTRADGHAFIINCKDALKNPNLDLEVFPGDSINVPRRPPFYF